MVYHGDIGKVGGFMSLKIGLLTSGGDCQGLNTALRGVAKALYESIPDVRMIGFLDGYRGLMVGDYKEMAPRDFSGILTIGGTILGTSRQPFKQMDKALNEGEPSGPNKLEAMVKTYEQMKMDGLVILGGNGTHKTAHALSVLGLNVITLPKTIDNDLWGTEMTFGFQSAVNIATLVIDSIHTTATSHGRVFIIELMGHKAGWLTLHAGIAGGADIILIPEIPYSIDAILCGLEKRQKQMKKFSIIALAEGAITKQEAAMSKKEFRQLRSQKDFPSVSYQLADALTQKTGQEIRVTIPGHFQRGGQPSAYDRVLATALGTAAAEQILKKQFGVMMGLQNHQIVPVSLKEVAGRIKTVPTDSLLIQSAKALGTIFGDETC